MFSHIVRQWVTLSFFVVACSFFLRKGKEKRDREEATGGTISENIWMRDSGSVPVKFNSWMSAYHIMKYLSCSKTVNWMEC